MDSDAVVALVMFVGILMLAAGGMGFMAGQHIRESDLRSLFTDPDDFDDPDWRPSDPGPVVDAEIVEDREPVALPIDPNNPPTWRIARVDRDDVICNCHGKSVKQGERLLFWPMGDGVMRVYHEDATEAVGQ